VRGAISDSSMRAVLIVLLEIPTDAFSRLRQATVQLAGGTTHVSFGDETALIYLWSIVPDA
jgi:hypothetical protein